MDAVWEICPFVWEPASPSRFIFLGSNFANIFGEDAEAVHREWSGAIANPAEGDRPPFGESVPTAVPANGVWQWQRQRMQGDLEIWVGVEAAWGNGVWHGAFWSDRGTTCRFAQRHQTISQILQRLQDGARLRQRLLSAMSHEIRAPLTSAIGLLELLGQEPLPPAQQELVQMLTLCHRELMHVVHGVLDYSKLEVERDREPELTAFDVLACVEDTVDLLAVQARQKNLALTWEGPAEPLPLVWGERGALQQVLVNLVANGVKYTAAGRVALTVTVESQEGRHLWVQFAVQDTGPGIPAADQARIFEPFVRLDNQQRGTGLGLALCQKMVARMGGTLTVDSTVGQGSCFSLVLPLRRGPCPTVPTYPVPVVLVSPRSDFAQRLAALLKPWQTPVTVCDTGQATIAHLTAHPCGGVWMDWQLPDITGELLAMQVARCWPSVRRVVVGDLPAHGSHTVGTIFHHRLTEPLRRSRLEACLQLPESAPPPPPVPSPSPRGTVLVVDDNPGNLLVVRAQVESLGYRVLTAAHGQEALNQLGRHRVDLVLMDCHMPTMDGFEATRRWRHQEQGRRLPIVAITAGMFAEDRERCLAAGMDDFLLKPVTRADLKAVCDR
ncbi:MAG: response regulator [Oscillatoriales cyanobacterium SM2_1_8]|nr:response regulator [Oscillatoriales cyanobacterium SM2_1_8]